MTDFVATLPPPPAIAKQGPLKREVRPRIAVRKLDALFGSQRAVRDVSMRRRVSARREGVRTKSSRSRSSGQASGMKFAIG